MYKIAKKNLPDAVYNWIKDFFDSRMHCTKFRGEVSEPVDILAVVQGSGLGPAAYIVNAADLQPIHRGNDLVTYTDDTYLVISAVNNHTCVDELQRVQAWAKENNLRLNASKCTEADDQLFDRLINDTNHVLHRLLPPPTTLQHHRLTALQP